MIRKGNKQTDGIPAFSFFFFSPTLKQLHELFFVFGGLASFPGDLFICYKL